MKIVITNAYARGSGGDMAILDSLISELRRVFESPEIVVATIDEPAQLEQIFPDVRCVSSLITTVWKEEDPRVLKLVALLASFLSTILWCLCHRISGKDPDWLLKKSERETVQNLAAADLVVAVGGGYIREESGWTKIIDLAITLRLLYLSHLLGKTTTLYSQSIGPFGNREQEKLATFVLQRMQVIITRESVSRELLRRMGIPDQRVLESTDCAFLAQNGRIPEQEIIPREMAEIKRDFTGPLVGATARDWLSAGCQAHYEQELARTLDGIILKYDAHVVLIPQTTVARKEDDDRIVQERIFRLMAQKNRATCMVGAYGHRELLTIYGHLDFLIGTRFHSAIFSLTARVPALVIAYEHKAVGIMRDLALESYVLDIKRVESRRLLGAFDRMFQNREKYLRQLDRTLPDYIARAGRAAEKIREVYRSSEQSRKLAAVGPEETTAEESLAQQERPGNPDRAAAEQQIE